MPLRALSYLKSFSEVPPNPVAAFRKSMTALTDTAIKLRDGITKWEGDTIGAAFILKATHGAVNDIHACVGISRELKEWTDEEEDEAFSVITNLVDILTQGAGAAIIARPKFRKIYFIGDPVALAMLNRLRDAVTELVGILICKAREERADDADALVSKVEGNFSRTIAAFSTKVDESSKD